MILPEDKVLIRKKDYLDSSFLISFTSFLIQLI